MDFLQDAASKYMGGSKPSKGGDGGVDWSNLAAMAQQFSKADKHTGDQELEPSTFKKFLGAFGDDDDDVKPQGEKPPAGYPSKPDTDVIHQLLGQFTNQTGEKFEGAEPQYEILQKISKQFIGYEIPVPMLKKMIKWKLNGLV